MKNGKKKPVRANSAKKSRGRAGETSDKGQTIRTIDGADVPVIQLAHIAPHLRAFAVPVDSLSRDSQNARSHTDHDLPVTAESLRRFGQQELIQFEPRGKSRVIKIGNGRHEAAQSILGWKWIAAVPSTLPAEQLKAFALAHNRTGERAGWLEEQLDRQLRELRELRDTDEIDLDLTGLGFEEEMRKLDAELRATSIDTDRLDDVAEDDHDSGVEGEDADGEEDESAADPSFEPQGPETQPRLDQAKALRCPNCQHEFVPRK